MLAAAARLGHCKGVIALSITLERADVRPVAGTGETKMRGLLVVLTVLAASAQPALTLASDARALAVLSASKQAAGGAAWDSVHFLRARMHLATSGLSGTRQTLEDVQAGRFVTSYDLGAIKGANGYDGTSIWQQDASGQVNIEGTEADKQGAIDDAYRAERAYWYSDRMSADITDGGTKTEGPRRFDLVAITPKGGRLFTLWIDAKTHLVDRFVEAAATETDTTFFSNYHAVEGKLVPFAAHETNGIAKYDSVIEVDSVAFESTAPQDAFAPPPPPKPDFGFIGGASSATVPMTLVNNHMYVPVSLNGKGPFDLVFDTGGSNIITPTVAAELGVKPTGALQGGGVGSQTQDVGVVKIDRMTIGETFLDNQTFAVIGLESFGQIEGKPIIGIFGYEVFKRFVVDTDYEHNKVTLISPAAYAYKGSGVRVPFVMQDTNPAVQGSIDGIAGTFTLDTGSRNSLDLLSPFVAQHDLVKKYGAKIEGVAGWGVGGPARAFFARAHKLSFGAISVDDPVVNLSEQKKGAYSDKYLAGNIGAGVLKRFNIVWNYPHQEIYFEKNALYDQPDTFDRAGFWANIGSDGFDVIDVYAGAPAAEAGLKIGDHILGVDGLKTGSQISLVDLRARQHGSPGSSLALEIKRGSKTKTILITLRDLV